MYVSKKNELTHYGILGQRWGVRRYQNEDGTLTPAGKARYAKQYKNAVDKVTKNIANNYNSLYVKGYNNAANYANNGGITKFNQEQEEKYGSNYASLDSYETEYVKWFDNVLESNLNKVLLNAYESNSNYVYAEALAEKYDMVSWNSLAQENASTIAKLKELVANSRY